MASSSTSTAPWAERVAALSAPNPFAQRYDRRLLQRVKDYDRRKAKVALLSALIAAILILWLANTYIWVLLWHHSSFIQVAVNWSLNLAGAYFFLLAYYAALELWSPPRISVTERERQLLGLPMSDCVHILPVIPEDTKPDTLSSIPRNTRESSSSHSVSRSAYQPQRLQTSHSMLEVSSTDAQGFRYRGKLAPSSSYGRVQDDVYMSSPAGLQDLWNTPTPVKGGFRALRGSHTPLPTSSSEASVGIASRSRLFTASGASSRYKYQAARTPVVSTREESDELGVQYTNAAFSGYHALKMAESIFESRERIREWVAQRVVQNTIVRLQRRVERYKPPSNLKPTPQPTGSTGVALGSKSGFGSSSFGGSAFGKGSSGFSGSTFGKTSTGFGGSSATSEKEKLQQRLEKLHQNYEQAKRQLEEYSKVPGYASTEEYVKFRTMELGSTREMIHFTWNGGGRWDRKDWTTDLPTDAELVMHLFCTFMNHQLQALPSVLSEAPFSSRYMVVYPQKPDANKVTAVIFQRHKGAKPHFEVYKKGELVRVMPGPDNVLDALIIFIHVVKQELKGFINSVDLSSPQIELIQCLA